MRNFELAPFGRRSPFSIFNDFEKELAPVFKNMEENYLPKVDMGERDGHFWASFDVPGVNKDDIHVSINEDIIIVKGERKEENRGDKYCEKYYGSFQRSFRVPPGYDLKRVDAHHENGVLSIVIPESEVEEKKPKKIEVNSGEESLFKQLFK